MVRRGRSRATSKSPRRCGPGSAPGGGLRTGAADLSQLNPNRSISVAGMEVKKEESSGGGAALFTARWVALS